MKFSLFYQVAVASGAELGAGLLGLDRGRYQTTINELREQAKCADEYGWTSLMLAEHHFEVEGYQVTPNPLLLNVYLAQHTSRLRHGQMGLVLPNWNPLRLAEDIAVADHLTGGRLDVGLARGYQSRSSGVLGQHYGVSNAGSDRAGVEARNRQVFEEWFEIMRRSWTSDLWSHESDLIKVPPPGLSWTHPVSARLGAGVTDGEITQVAIVPKPLQTPYPPLFTMLTQSPQTLDWAARVGSSIVTIASDPDMIAGLFHGYADAAARYGRAVRPGSWQPGGGVALCRLLSVASTHEEAWARARSAVGVTAEWLGEFGFFEAWRLPGQEGAVPRTLEQVLGKLPSAQRARLLASEPYPRLTTRTPASAAELDRKIQDGERSGIHVEGGEVVPGLWCCAVGLGPGPNGEVLSLSIMSFGEPDETRMCNVLRREIRDVGNALREAG